MPKGKIRWKLVKLPEPLWRDVKSQASKEKIAIWKLIERSLSLWRTASLGHFKAMPDVSKASWYAYKFSASVGEFRGKPTEENLRSLLETCKQVSQRLGVDTSKVALAAEQHLKRPTSKSRMVLNDASKEVVAQILLALSKEQQRQSA